VNKLNGDGLDVGFWTTPVYMSRVSNTRDNINVMKC